MEPAADVDADGAAPVASCSAGAPGAAAGQPWSKVHTSALCIIPPAELWEPIQAIRRKHDKQINRWMPHINVAYPFCGAASFPRAAEALAAELRSVPPFRIRFAAFGHFEHGPRCRRTPLPPGAAYPSRRSSATLWLRPDTEPPGALGALQGAVVRAMPAMDDLSARFGAFRPHLSLGQFRGPRDAETAGATFARDWRPIEFEVRELCLIARDGPDASFAVRATVPLGRPPRPPEP